MSLILNIETATKSCSVALAKDGKTICFRETLSENSHSSLVTTFIEEIFSETAITVHSLDAVAVSKGPGSYTGLRIGVSTAKGLCFASDKPLIAVGTLKAMALGIIDSYQTSSEPNLVFCPMIDARRMEVYTAVYDAQLNLVHEVSAEIIDEYSFSKLLKTNKVVFFGDGADKCREVLGQNENALFIGNVWPSAKNMAALSFGAYKNNNFEDVAYFEPYYLKDFVAGMPKVKGLK